MLRLLSFYLLCALLYFLFESKCAARELRKLDNVFTVVCLWAQTVALVRAKFSVSPKLSALFLASCREFN
jgi:hypothetical protein